MLSQEQPLPKERRPKNSPEGPSKNKAQPADSDVALTNDPVSAPTIAQLQSAIIAALHQAHTDTQSAEWLQVIAVCETIISQCVQCNELSAQKSVPDNTLSAAAMYRAKGQVLLEKGQLPTAIESLEQSLQHDNDQVDVHEDLARLYSQSQQWTQAIHHYEYLLSAVPDDSAALVRDAIAQAWAHLAQALKQSGEIHSTVRAYLTALKYQPLLYMAYNRLRYNLMRYDIAEGDPILGEVVETISAIVSENPGLKSAEVALGYALTRLGRLDEATDCYLQASEQSTRRQIAQRSYLLSDLAQQDRARPDSVQAVELLAARQQPAFLVIGAEKSGTTSLYQYLSSHPQLLSPIEKEIDFFDAEYSRGLDWYLAHFPAVCQKNGEPSSFITGETSANYLYDAAAPERVFNHFPQIRLIVAVRHPVDRTISRYNMMVRNGAEKRSLEVAMTEEIELIEQATENGEIPWSVLNRCRHVGNSLYYYHLQRWLRHFPLEQLLVLRSEDLFDHPEQTLTQICEALTLCPPLPQLYKKHNAGSYDSASSDIRQRLFAFFEPHTHKLETLLSRSFDWT